jgi:hypothetical protein
MGRNGKLNRRVLASFLFLAVFGFSFSYSSISAEKSSGVMENSIGMKFILVQAGDFDIESEEQV